MIERLEVAPGPGTVIRYGSIAAWASSTASPSLLSFLAQSARNLGPSPTGGEQVADHLATVLRERDPEPHVPFAVIGPSPDGWAALLHGPVQVWDGVQWLSANPRPGWLRCSLSPRPSLSVTVAGAPVPSMSPDSLWDLEAGVVPGGGFLLMPAVRAPSAPLATPVEEGEQAGTIDLSAMGIGREPLPPEPAALPYDQPVGTEAPEQKEAPREPVDAAAAVGAAAAGAGLAETSEAPPTEAAAASTEEAATEEAVTEEPDFEPGPQGSLNLRSRRVRQRAIPYPPLPTGRGGDRAVPGAPVVAGTLCPRGHINRPGMTACVRCGTLIPPEGSYSVSGTRPALGCLIMDDGSIYRLDRGYLVGSNPARDPTVRGGLALPLVLQGHDVSTTHAEVRLHDWDVLLTDRASAGGTSVFEPDGTDWERLRPYEPRVLKPGTHVAFGQRVVTFVTPWIPGHTPAGAGEGD